MTTASQQDEITRDQLATLLGLKSATIAGLVKKGILETRGRNAYSRTDCVQRYCAYLRASAIGRPSSDAKLNAQKERIAKAQAEKLEIANAKSRGELLPVGDVRAEWLGIISDLRARMLAVPSRVAASLSLDPPTTAKIDSEIIAALTEISETSPAKKEVRCHDDLI
jgi:phage terminase Nu1 subunit (DNA packaging protein)